MTQKEALKRALEYAQQHFAGEGNSMMAARAAFVILWLEDINWHSEARALSDRTLATLRLKGAFEKVMLKGELQDAVALFDWIFGWGLKTDEWREIKGAPLVEELWNIITALPA